VSKRIHLSSVAAIFNTRQAAFQTLHKTIFAPMFQGSPLAIVTQPALVDRLAVSQEELIDKELEKKTHVTLLGSGSG
jgi:hypothetical protein